MKAQVAKIRHRYRQILEAHMILPDEKNLAEIADIARDLVWKVSPEEIFEMHFSALSEIGRERKNLRLNDVSDGLSEVVFELIMGISLAHREALFQRTQAERALNLSNQRVRAIFESAHDALIVCDKEGKIVFWNLGAEKICSLSATQVLGKPVWQFFEKESCDLIAQIFSGQKLLQNDGSLSLRGVCCGNESVASCLPKSIALEGNFSRWDDDQGALVLMVLRDVSARKAAEEELAAMQEQLRLAQRLESVGNLAAGVAHDFNNVLAVIFSECDLALAQMRTTDSLLESFANIQKSAQHARQLTQQLLAFGRKQILRPKLTSLNHVIQDLKPMLSCIVPKNVRLCIAQSPSLGLALLDETQMQQVILNLSLNARDAMAEQGGTLLIQTENINVNEDSMVRSSLKQIPPGAYVSLLVQDTGCGLPPNLLPKIFDPFFTTKSLDQGTGLGLPSVYGIVKQSDGFIYVESEVGVGTTFRLYFARFEEPAH